MNLQRWILQRKPDWQKLEHLLDVINAEGLKGLSGKEILRLGSLYRSASADLSRSRATNAGEDITDYLNSLTSRAHNIVYRIPQMKFNDITGFFVYDFPQTFRTYFPQFLVAFFIFWIGAAIAMTTVHVDPGNTSTMFLPESTIERLSQGEIWTESVEASPLVSSMIMKNNIQIALTAFAYGLLFGVGTLYIMFMNGFMIGGSIQVVIENGIGYKILTFIAAHGVIELMTVYIAGAAGLILGWALISPGEYKRWDAVKLKAKDAGRLALGCVFLLIIAGTIEGLVSPNDAIHPFIKFGVAGITGILLFLYLGFCGRSGLRKT